MGMRLCYFKNYYQMMAKDLNKQQEQNANPKAIKLINFFCKSRLSRKNNNLFITEEAKETTLDLA